MNPLQAAILGIIEGLTEFLPISSTFHLIWAGRFLGVPDTEFTKVFEVVIQSGSILAVVFLYARELWNDKGLAFRAALAFIPTGLIGFALHDVVKGYFFESEALMLTMMAIVSVVFIMVELWVKDGSLRLAKDTGKLTIRDALIIGVVQSLAVIPGVSRAGAVIVGMMFMQYRRDEAARFSFMLSIPTIFMASAYDLLKMRHVLIENTANIGLLAIGCFTAFVSAFLVMRWFIRFLRTNSLIPFAIYRLVLVIIIVSLLVTGWNAG
jgi:undecaprenyl-diphosphatase